MHGRKAEGGHTESAPGALVLGPDAVQIKQSGKRHLLIVIAEGAIDHQGVPIKAEAMRSLIEARVNIETRVTVLGHTQRGGRASFFDRFTVRAGAARAKSPRDEGG